MAEFAVAVTVRVYVPAGVPPEPDDPDDPLPHERSSANPAIVPISRSKNRFGRRDIGNTNIPMPRIADAHSQREDDLGKSTPDMFGAVVVTITERVDALVALTVTVPGTEQAAFAGAPVQLRDALALIPSPPMLTV